MTTRSQKRKAVEELVSQDLETLVAENNQTENLIAGPSKSPKILGRRDQDVSQERNVRPCQNPC